MVMDKKSTYGLYTATTTPFDSNGQLNTAAVGQQVEALLAAGVTGIVTIGGTGEASALSISEKLEIVEATAEAVDSRVPVVAGITSPGLPDALNLSRECLTAGADGLMVITPYGTAPSQEGIRDYYKAIADGIGQSVMLYDIPYLTSVATEPETVRNIVDDGSIFSMKASSADQAAFVRLTQLVGADIAIMSGDEHLFAVQIALGAAGGVLASCNVLPRTWVEIFQTAKAGDFARAQKQLFRLNDFLVSVYSEPNPGPLKAAQKIAGFDAGGVRIPNRAPGRELTEKLQRQLADLLPYERAFEDMSTKVGQ